MEHEKSYSYAYLTGVRDDPDKEWPVWSGYFTKIVKGVKPIKIDLKFSDYFPQPFNFWLDFGVLKDKKLSSKLNQKLAKFLLSQKGRRFRGYDD
jgi:hypothetical protein